MAIFGNNNIGSKSLGLPADDEFGHFDVDEIVNLWDADILACTVTKMWVYAMGSAGSDPKTLRMAVYDASDGIINNWTVEAESPEFAIISDGVARWYSIDCDFILTTGKKALAILAYDGNDQTSIYADDKDSGVASLSWIDVPGEFDDPLGTPHTPITYNWSMYAEYSVPPAPPNRTTATWHEFNGDNTPENSSGSLVTNINFGNTDKVNIVPTDYPVIIGSNSYFKQLAVNFSGTYTSISNMQLYKKSGDYVTGETIQFSGNVDSGVPNTVNQGDPEIPASSGLCNVAPQGGTTGGTLPSVGETQSSPGYYSGSRTSLMRFQLITTEDTPAIAGNQKIISLTYDRQ